MWFHFGFTYYKIKVAILALFGRHCNDDLNFTLDAILRRLDPKRPPFRGLLWIPRRRRQIATKS